MKSLDLTNVENIVEFAENPTQYLKTTSLPKSVKGSIDLAIEHYKVGYLTRTELKNQIIVILDDFIKE